MRVVTPLTGSTPPSTIRAISASSTAERTRTPICSRLISRSHTARGSGVGTGTVESGVSTDA